MNSSQPSTVELLARARTGEEDALADLFELHEPELRRRVDEGLANAGRARDAAEDVLLETYLIALRRLDEFRSKREGAFGRWLDHIARLRVSEALRAPAPPAPRPVAVAVVATPEPVEAVVVEPTVVEPTVVEPTVVEPTAVEPAAVEAVAVDPVDPVVDEVVEPAAAEAVVAEPVAIQPVVADPVVVDEVVEPAAVEPAAVEPAAVEPAAVEPVAEPVVAEPVAIDEVAEPVVVDDVVDDVVEPVVVDAVVDVEPVPIVDDAAELTSEASTALIDWDLVPSEASTTIVDWDSTRSEAATVVPELPSAPAHPTTELWEPLQEPAAEPAEAAEAAEATEPTPEREAEVVVAEPGLVAPEFAAEDEGDGEAEPAVAEVDPVVVAITAPEEPVAPEGPVAAEAEVEETPAVSVEQPPVSEDLFGLIEALESLDAGPDAGEQAVERSADDPLPDPVAEPVPEPRPEPLAEPVPEPLPQTFTGPLAGPLPEPERRSGGLFGKLAIGATILVIAAAGVGVEMHLSDQRGQSKEIARQLDEDRAVDRLRAERKELAEEERERERAAAAAGQTALERERQERAEREAALERERAARDAREGERDGELAKSRAALRSARALGLANASRIVAAENSMLSLILANEAAANGMLPQLYGPLHEALRASRTRWVRRSSAMEEAGDTGAPARFEGARFSASGSHVLAWSSGTDIVTVWDIAGGERALVRAAEDHIWNVEWSPSSDTFVIALGDGVTGARSAAESRGSASVRDVSGKEIAALNGHADDVFSAVYAPQGDRILTVSADGTARLWDTQGKELATMAVAAEPSGGSATFSPDGERVLTAGVDGKIAIWTRDGEPVSELFTALGRLESARFTPAGDRVLTIAEFGTEARLLSLKGNLVTVFPGPSGTNGTRGPYRNLYATFSPSGDRLLTASQDGVARLWNLDGEVLHALEGHAATYLQASFSPRGDRIVTASADGTSRLWDAQGRALAVLDQPEGAVTAAAFSPSGEHVLTLDTAGLAILSEIDDGDVPVLGSGTAALTRVAVTDEHIVTASTDHDARVWDLRGRLRAVLTGHRDPVRGVECSPSGDFVLTHSDDGTAKLWRTDGEEVATFRARERDVWSATFSPDGARVLLGCGDGKARLCEPLGDIVAVFDPTSVERPGDPERVGLARDRAIRSATFSRGGTEVFTTNGEGDVHAWDLRGGHLRALGTLGVPLLHARDGDRLLALDRDTWAWNLYDARGESLRAKVGVSSARFSAAGDVVLGAGGNDAWLLPARKGRFDAAEFPKFAHDDVVLAAVFSPDEKRIATGCGDRAARVWSRDGTLLAVLRGHAGPVVDLRFTPDGRRLVTASEDGTARVWLIDGPALRALAARRVLRELDPAERRRFAGLLGEDD